MRIPIGWIWVVCIVLAVPAYLAADRAHDLAAKAATQKVARCPSGLDSATCHAQFPTGCSAAIKPTYDAYLNFLKDQDPGPSASSAASLTSSDFASLESKLPKTLNGQNHANFAQRLADNNEGNIVTVIGFLYFAADTGKASNGPLPIPETSNCRLTAPDSFDYHLGIGFDAAIAKKILLTKPQSNISSPTDMEKTSVVAEMTPHTRHQKWTFARVSALQGKQVKVVGQLMVDNVHFNAKDDCQFPSAQPSCWRSTVWEVHPVTQFFACNLDGGCDKNSPDSAWTRLDDLP